MIFEVFQILTEQVNQYFNKVGLDDSNVILENISFVDAQNENGDSMKDKVVLSLINIQEEVVLKNFPNHRKTDDTVELKNPVINLQLYVLFSAHRKTYSKSLKDISAILEFFQGKNVFTQSNTIFDRDLAEMSDVKDFKFTMELMTPSFEDLNFIWSTLGGRQLPSILYKLNLIKIERDLIKEEGALITEINRIYKEK